MNKAISKAGSPASRLVGVIAGILALCCIFLGCGGSGGGGGGETDHELVRFIHVNPDYSALDFAVADQENFKDLAYGEESGYFDVVEGKNTFSVTSELQVLPIVEKELTIDAGKDYTILFVDAANAPDLVQVSDDRSIPDDGEFRLRVGNLAPSRSSLDVYIVHPGDSVDDQTPLATALAYQSFADYKGIPAGSYQLKYTNAGSSHVIRSTDVIEFNSGGVYTHVLIDPEGGRGTSQSRLFIDAEY